MSVSQPRSTCLLCFTSPQARPNTAGRPLLTQTGPLGSQRRDDCAANSIFVWTQRQLPAPLPRPFGAGSVDRAAELIATAVASSAPHPPPKIALANALVVAGEEPSSLEPLLALGAHVMVSQPLLSAHNLARILSVYNLKCKESVQRHFLQLIPSTRPRRRSPALE